APAGEKRGDREIAPLMRCLLDPYFRCLFTRAVISNIDTCGLPNSTRSLSSALIIRLLAESCRLCFLMYSQIFLTTSVRGPALAAGLRVAAFLAAGFLAAAFRATGFLAAAFLAAGFLAAAFFAAGFLAATFLAATFFAAGFLAAAFFAAGFFAAAFFAADLA